MKHNWKYLLVFLLLFSVVLNVNAEESIEEEKIESITLITYNDLGNGKGKKVIQTVVDEEAIEQFDEVFELKKKDNLIGVNPLWEHDNEIPTICLDIANQEEKSCYNFKTNNIIVTIEENSQIFEIIDGNDFYEYVKNLADEYAEEETNEEKLDISGSFDSIVLTFGTSDNTYEIKDKKEIDRVLKILNSNYLPYKGEYGLGGVGIPTLKLKKGNETIEITMIYSNLFGVRDSFGIINQYVMTYGKDSRASILEVFGVNTNSNTNNKDNVNSPETGDNTLLIIGLAAAAATLAVVAYRKTKCC